MARITKIDDLKIDDLMFPVELRPVYYMDKGAQQKIPNRQVVVNGESGKHLGVVSNSYQLVSNKQALDMGEKYCADLFGTDEVDNIEVFRVFAPSTGSYCHIDLVHRSYAMDLWDKQAESDIYIPYLRVTNSYNRSRALRFDIGVCRKVCLNGTIFDPETVTSAYRHIKREFTDAIPSVFSNGKIKQLSEAFRFYTTKLRNYHIPRAQALEIIRVLFRIKDENEIDFESETESREQYDSLLGILDCRLEKYIDQLGDNSYALFNAITDIASHAIERNRYLRHDMHRMQRLAGDWIFSFQREIESPAFDIDSYLEQLNRSRNGSSASMRGDSAVQGRLF